MLDRAPRRKANGSELGLDADEKVAVVRDYGDDEGLVWETFAACRGGDRHHATFERGVASGISISRYDGERLTAVDTCTHAGGWNQERYSYTGDRMVTIEREMPDSDDVVQTERWELAYGERGELREVNLVAGPGAPARVWMRSTPSIEPLVVDSLVEAIRRAVAALGVDEPVYSLALAYDDRLPPAIGLGLERERVEWGDEAADFAWNPAEFELYADRAPGLVLDGDPELRADCDELNQALREQEREIEGTQAVCNAVAKRLNALDWQGHLPVTDDFVVYATDLELGELGENLRAVLGGRRVRQLVKRGLLAEEDA